MITTSTGPLAWPAFSLVLRQGGLLVGTGLAVGVIGTLELTRFMSGFVFGVKPTDLLTFAIVCPLIAMIALVACLGPARRASSIDPLVALRAD